MFNFKQCLFFVFFSLLFFFNIYSVNFSNFQSRNFPANTEIILDQKNIGFISNVEAKYALLISQALYYGDFLYLDKVFVADYDRERKRLISNYPFIIIGLKDFEHREMMANYEIAFSLFKEANNFFYIQELPKLDKVKNAGYIKECETNISVNNILIKHIIDNFYYLDKLDENCFKDNIIDINLLNLNSLFNKIMEFKTKNSY